MKKLSVEFKIKANDIIKKLEELLFVVKKEWDALVKNDFDLIWTYSKEKNDIFQELKEIKKDLNNLVNDFIRDYGGSDDLKEDQKWEIIRKNVHFSDYLFLDCFLNRYRALKEEIVYLNSHNMNWAKDQIENISKILEIFVPKTEKKNLVYSPQTVRNGVNGQKGYYKGV